MPDIDPRSFDPRMTPDEFGHDEFSLRDALFGHSSPVGGVIENSAHISLRTWSDGTHVVIAELADVGRRFTGTARCHPIDTFDYGTGYAIAVSRAFKAYTNYLMGMVPDGC